MGDQESLKERMIRLEETQKVNAEKFDAILQALSALDKRMRQVERWMAVSFGFCSFAAFVGPFVVKSIFPNL